MYKKWTPKKNHAQSHYPKLNTVNMLVCFLSFLFLYTGLEFIVVTTAYRIVYLNFLITYHYNLTISPCYKLFKKHLKVEYYSTE